MTWRFLFSLPGEYEHRLFYNDEGELSVCDHSGGNPDLTDDGPLLLIRGSTGEANISQFSPDRVQITMPVVKVRDEHLDARVTMDIRVFNKARDYFDGDLYANVEAGTNLWKVVRDLQRSGLFSIERNPDVFKG